MPGFRDSVAGRSGLGGAAAASREAPEVLGGSGLVGDAGAGVGAGDDTAAAAAAGIGLASADVAFVISCFSCSIS